MSTQLAQAETTTPAHAEGVSVPLPHTDAQVNTPLHGGEESLFPPFDIDAFPSHIFWLAIAFGILFYFVNRLVVPKVGGILEDRRDRIASDLGEANRLSRETDEVIAAYEAELATARQKAYGIAQERRDEIKAEQARQQAETEATLNARIADAEAEIVARRDAALADVNQIATEATRAIVDRLTGIQVTEADVAEAVRQSEATRA
ncbi:F0F1 ATP synthase subunit B [Acuticoccus sp. M5D2P5]|uniref:F0F1 ATP synthase subunit B n=1 Tax=Acuticoccus kalidii TaxID=2910977 RepID=UPI001EFFA202|nr:F0F1 ATP synthase subunit B [Acuticoccus kalidii]MCF3934627.1 F0F1 ATP synthase subunit B [Acuticoccus kalidii]